MPLLPKNTYYFLIWCVFISLIHHFSGYFYARCFVFDIFSDYYVLRHDSKTFSAENSSLKNIRLSYPIDQFRNGYIHNDSSFFIENGLRSGVFKYDRKDHTSEDDSSMVIKVGNKRFVRQFEGPVNVQWFGAKGDGISNDFDALNQALFYASKKSDSVFLPKSIYFVKVKGPLTIEKGIKFYGERGTVINLDSDTPNYSSFINNNGNDITISTLQIQRVADYPFVLFPIRSFKNIRFENIVINGNKEKFTTSYCHAFQLGVNEGKTTGVILKNCWVKGCKFGLFMTNTSSSAIQDVLITDCKFESNLSTDLEFNSPNGSISNINIYNNTFSGGKAFGVGMAHVANAKVFNNHFKDYDLEAIHIEDYSKNITICKNIFISCSLLKNAYIQIISGTENVKVLNNNFDGSENRVPNQVINVQTGGTGQTAGDREVIPPNNIEITGNQIILAPSLNGIYLEKVDSSLIKYNTFISAERSIFDSESKITNFGIKIFAGKAGRIIKNNFQGLRHGIAPLQANIRTHNLSNPQIISSNTFHSCYIGIAAVNISNCTIDSNYFEKCEYPVISGQIDNRLPKILRASNNTVFNCLKPFSLLDTINVRCISSATIGTNKTIAIQPLNGALPIGAKVILSNGSHLILKKYASYLSESLVGDVSIVNIPSNVSGKAYGDYISDESQVRQIFNNKFILK